MQTALEAANVLPNCARNLKMTLIAVQGINLCQAREIAAAVELLRDGIGLAIELGNIEYRARMSGLMAGAQFSWAAKITVAPDFTAVAST